MRVCLLLWLTLLGAFPAWASSTILVLGDSLSAGYGVPRDQAWVTLLQNRLTQERYTARVVNASISGETTAGGKYRLPALLAQHKPAIVIVELGGNDGLRGLPLTATRSNLDAIIRASKQSRAQVLLLGMRLPPNYGPDYTEPFMRAYEELAKKHRIPRVPFFLAPIAGKRDYFQADGIHPTAPAQPLLLDTVWPVLKPMLRQKT